MGSLLECRLEGFVCRLCSQIDRNVIHIYTEEGKTLFQLDFGTSVLDLECSACPGVRSVITFRSLKILGLQKKLEQKINVYLKINVSFSQYHPR